MAIYSPFEGMRDLVPVEEMPPVRTDRDIYHVWRLLLERWASAAGGGGWP